MSEPDQHLIESLELLDILLDDNIARSREMRRRLRKQRRGLAAGRPLNAMIADEPIPRVTELITENIDGLHGIGARVRAAQASALRDEGLSMASIADLFGVTRQRVSALLNQKAAERG